MSWHTGGVAIEGDVASDPAAVTAALGFAGEFRGQTVSGDGAGSGSLHGRAVGRVGGWTFVWDPLMLMGDDPAGAFDAGIFPTVVEERLAALSRGRRVFAFLTEGTSSTHGYAVYFGGNRTRLWLQQEGQPVMDEGPAIREEQPFADEEDGEERVLGLLQAVTGVNFDEIFATEFQVVE